MGHGNTRGRARALAATFAVGALLAASAAPASAATTPASWWVDAYDIAAVHAEGWTGEGVKIAVYDGAINPDLPVFAGQNLTVDPVPVCAGATSAVISEPTDGSRHGSTSTALLIGNGQGAGAVSGIAPDADVTFYSRGDVDGACDGTEYPDELTGFGEALQRAVDDGADIFTSSFGGPGLEDETVVANALAAGMVVVVATTNPRTESWAQESSLDSVNGILAVSAVDQSGDLQVQEDGSPYIVEATRTVAAGVRLPSVGAEGSWDESVSQSGSSNSAPLVAGMLALTAQRYPDATGDQLLQTLIHTTNGSTHEPTYEPATGYGYGAAVPASMLADDPTARPDVNPFMDRPAGWPTEALVEEASARGSVYPIDAAPAVPDADGDTDPEPADPGASIAGTLLIVVLVVLGLIVVAGVITIVVVTTRKKRHVEGGTP